MNKDLLFNVARILHPADVHNFVKMSSNIHNEMSSEYFWRRRIEKDFWKKVLRFKSSKSSYESLYHNLSRFTKYYNNTVQNYIDSMNKDLDKMKPGMRKVPTYLADLQNIKSFPKLYKFVVKRYKSGAEGIPTILNHIKNMINDEITAIFVKILEEYDFDILNYFINYMYEKKYPVIFAMPQNFNIREHDENIPLELHLALIDLNRPRSPVRSPPKKY